MDLIGPWIVQVRGRPHEFDALTCIDIVTNLVKLIRVDDKTSETISRRYTQCWLSRYPWPQSCVHDPGGELLEQSSKLSYNNCHIKDVCTSAKNPQANAICKRMHQTVGNVMSTLLHGEPPQFIAFTFGLMPWVHCLSFWLKCHGFLAFSFWLKCHGFLAFSFG